MSQWLEKINDPADIRGLKIKQLKEVAEEIREEILRVMAINGGHLASSLGAVELAVALHHVYNTPADRLVWDVGHQAYAHKILTGRRGQFPTIRQDGGLSGFLKRSESPYDTFGAGHASTSISAALGMALARDRQNENYKVVSVTGDGAMSGGICYEALNNAGKLKSDLLVVLNDNRMSISKNTGALSDYFNKIVMTNFYNERRNQIVDFIKRMPAG
ncbi:1-deoxy-D-xylulose-5-phosphate synthase, partial [Candidatus Sumerlaeota bacterium]|nr:1-deoxy-D-xylulose-5-phosphate synthase [Candidatus Sumerlaeota bacterium]